MKIDHQSISNIQTKIYLWYVLLFFISVYPIDTKSQTLKGRILSSETNKGIGYVNIGIINKNIGTVSDEFGNFKIELNNTDLNDSVKFSMIGYASKTLFANYLITDTINTIYLDPIIYRLKEVKVTSKRVKKITLGIPVQSKKFATGFTYSSLGDEMGINVELKEKVRLTDINLNVGDCSYDSVIYRVNIYQYINQNEFQNILTEPIYISFKKNEIDNPITFDLSKYSITITGNILIALQLIKEMGEGHLVFRANENISYTLNRKSNVGSWRKVPGVIGLYLHGQIIK